MSMNIGVIWAGPRVRADVRLEGGEVRITFSQKFFCDMCFI